MLKLADATTAYLAYIKYQRGLSPRTIVGYASWIHHFQHWLEDNGYPEPTVDVLAYLSPTRREYWTQKMNELRNEAELKRHSGL